MSKKLQRPQKTYSPNDDHGASSKFGQMIGEAFDRAVLNWIADYLKRTYPEYTLLTPQRGKKMVRLEMSGGTIRQMDNVIVPVNSTDPVALFESKWLKDARHHNDKGAWILQLREVSKKYPTIRGAVANLAGYWTEGVGVMFEREGRITTVLVATDVEVYSTLQPYVIAFCERNGLPPLILNANEIRGSLTRAWDLANCLVELKDEGKLAEIAESWLRYERQRDEYGNVVLGSDLIGAAIGDLLKPLPDNPMIEKFEIALQLDTGNTIYQEFTDAEEALQFIQTFFANPKAILSIITPRPKS